MAIIGGCLGTILSRCSQEVRGTSADHYLLLRRQHVNARATTFDNDFRCSRGRVVERCLELTDMDPQVFDALDPAGLKYNEVTIDVHRDDVTGVFFTELDSGRDQLDLLPNAQAPTPIDHANGDGWRARKLVIARALADALDAQRGTANPVTLYMITAQGQLAQQQRQ